MMNMTICFMKLESRDDSCKRGLRGPSWWCSKFCWLQVLVHHAASYYSLHSLGTVSYVLRSFSSTLIVLDYESWARARGCWVQTAGALLPRLDNQDGLLIDEYALPALLRWTCARTGKLMPTGGFHFQRRPCSRSSWQPRQVNGMPLLLLHHSVSLELPNHSP
jgi:hypothetical protein